MTTQTQVWLLFFATAILSGLLVFGIGWGIWLIRDRMKSWLVIQDEDGGVAEVRRVVPRDGKVTIRGRRGSPDRVFFLHSKGRKNSKRGGLYIVDAKNGCTLIAPDRAEWEAILDAKETGATDPKEARLWAKMRYLDPLFNFHVLKTNVAQDFLRAREEKEHWMVKLAPLLAVCLVFSIGVIGFLVWKMGERGMM